MLYVMGSGHSGSTILGVTLGNCRGMFYAGELQNFLTRSGIPAVGGVERTRFWRRVRNEAPDAQELFGYGSHRVMERSGAVLRPHTWAARRSLRARYRRVTRDVAAAVASVAEAEYVVDTSHFPLRAAELQAIDGIDLSLIFLVREPEPVVVSIGRLINRNDRLEKWRSVLDTNLDLWLTHLLSIRVFRRQPEAKRLFLRYEDFIADPEGVLRQILDMCGSTAPIPDLERLSTGLTIQGNRLLRQEQVALKRGAPHGGERNLLTRIMQAPWEPVLSTMRPAAHAAPGEGGHAGA